MFIIWLKGVIPWQDFDWRTYVEKDWKPATDELDPVSRFGIHLRKSIDIGVHRDIPTYRYMLLHSYNWFWYFFLKDFFPYKEGTQKCLTLRGKSVSLQSFYLFWIFFCQAQTVRGCELDPQRCLARRLRHHHVQAVSYTHLTLPTILLV